MIHITSHAIMRFQERVENISAELIIDRLTNNRAIHSAIRFGSSYVKLGTGQRVVVKNGAIVTVLPKEHNPAKMGRDRDWRHSYAGDED